MPRPPIRALLIDLSGTLHIGSTPVPGAVEALARLRQHNAQHTSKYYSFRFCSNTSKEGRRELEERLRGMGFDVGLEGEPSEGSGREIEMWTSLGALSGLLRKQGLKKPFCLLQESAKREVLSDLGVTEHDGQRDYDSVVVGLAPKLFTYDHLNTAFRILLPTSASPAKPLIVTHRAKYVRTASQDGSDEHETLSLGPGPFVAALENATGVQAEVVGKPSRAFFETVIASFGSEARKASSGLVAIIGDDIETDLGGAAVELGLWRVLVKTGKYRPGDESRDNITPPDEVCESFAAFVHSLLQV